MAKAEGIPGGKNLTYNSINMNFALQLTAVRINSLTKMQENNKSGCKSAISCGTS